MRHELKTWPQHFTGIALGRKNFEVRFDDRHFAIGDELVLREWCPITGLYTDREEIRFVTYVLKGFEGLKDGFVVMGLQVEPF